jgi:hypothetical protein
MPASPWNLVDTNARLADLLQARVDLLRPEKGLYGVAHGNLPLKGWRLLRIAPPPGTTTRGDGLLDGYARGPDLVATYAQTAHRNVRSQYYWRSIGNGEYCGIELILSVQTSLLDSQPAMHVESQLGRGEVVRLMDLGTRRFVSVPGGANHSATVADGTGLLLMRPEEWDELSYAEMVHPSDFVRADVSADNSGVKLRTELFPESLEKGVIRRARMRALIIARSADEAVAAGLWSDFTAAAPPLTA